MTTFVGALLEAWDELRIHKLRVLLSLVGVAAAVAAMTGVLAIGQMMAQANNELMQRWIGRETVITIQVSPEDWEDTEKVAPAMRDFVDRFEIEFSSLVGMNWGQFSTDAGMIDSELNLIDHGYAEIHQMKLISGSWFGPGDAQRLAPAVVVNQAFLRATNTPEDLSQQPGLVMTGGAQQQSFVVIGAVSDEWEGESPRMWVLWDSYMQVMGEDAQSMMGSPALEIWVSPDDAPTAEAAARSFFQTVAGPNGWVDAWSNSGGLEEQDAFMETFQTVVLGIGTAVLAIGALSLVNISLVTVQQRIREIGIRRAFGATSGRVFFSIMMESVVATFLAGLVGVVIAAIVVDRFPVIEMLLQIPIENPPPFPLNTAIIGMVIATIIGAIAGLVPGLVATRIKPIDAMRAG